MSRFVLGILNMGLSAAWLTGAFAESVNWWLQESTVLLSTLQDIPMGKICLRHADGGDQL